MKKIVSPKKMLDILIKISFGAIIVLVPLFFAAFYTGANVFMLPKLIVFQIFFYFLFALVLSRLLIYKDWRFFKEIIDKKGYILLGLVLIILFAISVLASNNHQSFFGSYDHSFGFFSYVYLLIFFFLSTYALSLGNKQKNINNSLWLISVTAGLVAVYGVCQRLGFDFIIWSESTRRIVSSFGQPNFLASYFLLTLPITGYLFLINRSLYTRLAVFFIGSIQLLALYFTESRGAYLSFLIIVFITLFLVLKKKRFLVLMAILVVAVSAWFFLPRLHNIIDLRSGSVAARLQFWSASLKAINVQPILGYGLEGQSEALAPYYEPDWAIYTNINVIPERAHNLILDIFLASGVIGFFVFLFVLLYVYKQWFYLLRKNRKLALTLGAAILGYFLSLLFSFPIFSLSVYLVILLSIIFSLNSDYTNQEQPKLTIERKIVVFLLFILAFFLSSQAAKRLQADYYFFGWQKSFLQKEYFTAYIYYDYITQLKVTNYSYDSYFLASIYDASYENLDYSTRAQGEKIAALVGSKYLDRNKYYSWRLAFWSLALQGDYEGARSNLESLIAYSPNLTINYYDLGRLAYRFNDQELQEESLAKAKALLPNMASPYLNDLHKRFVQSFLLAIEAVGN